MIWLMKKHLVFSNPKMLLATGVLFFMFFLFAQSSLSQTVDSTKVLSHYAGSATITHNGISLIPTFSLGKPAAIFDLSLGKRNLSFEPQLRFALEGKPWSFIFWWRYKLLKTRKFSVNVGAHPSIVFKTITATNHDVSKNLITAQRYLAGELSPNYFLSKNVSIGLYYLYSHGLEKDAPQNTHFLTINSNFSNIKLPHQFYLKFSPQVYYLKMDKQGGFYATSTLTLAKRNFPLSISSILNKVIQTHISASKDFVWNLNLIYAVHKQYVQK